MPDYRLDREQWIPVLGCDGGEHELSLSEVIREAPRIRRVTGTPLEAAALMRFLLALTYLAETPANLGRWYQLWQDREAFLERMRAYIDEHAGVWDLFDRDRPFGQDPTLSTEDNPAYLLTYETARKNNPLLLDHRQVEHPTPVEHASLARGILATQAFGGSTAMGKADRMPMGPLCVRTVVFLEGETLDRTLLFNLLAGAPQASGALWDDYGRAPRKVGAPADAVERLMWTTRRVRLMPSSDSSVVLAAIRPGDAMDEDALADDPFVALQLDAEGKKYVPLRFEAGKALWRSAHALLAINPSGSANQLAGRPLPALDQLRRLAMRYDGLALSAVTVRACGAGGNAQGPVTDLWRDETLPFGLSVLTDDARYAALERAVAGAEETARKLRGRLKWFALAYLRNGGHSSPKPKDAGRLADELAPNLAGFWSDIGPKGERIALDDFDDAAWEKELAAASDRAFRKAIDRLPPDARRLRAEFARAEAGQDTPKGGKKTA